MAMNREQRRMLQKQGQIDAEGNAVRARRDPRSSAPPERVGPAEYVREVRSEMRRVNWPTRRETINYTIVVMVTLVILTMFIAGLDYTFGEGIIRLLRLADS